jgi:hypothetical protein
MEQERCHQPYDTFLVVQSLLSLMKSSSAALAVKQFRFFIHRQLFAVSVGRLEWQSLCYKGGYLPAVTTLAKLHLLHLIDEGETHHVMSSALNIAIRFSRNGSLTILLEALMTMVARSAPVKTGQWGSLGVLGSPVRANAIQASLTLSASAIASWPPPVSLAQITTLSKAEGHSMLRGDFSCPPCTGVSHAK